MKEKIDVLLEEAFGENYEPDSTLKQKNIQQLRLKKSMEKNPENMQNDNLHHQRRIYKRWQPVVAMILVVCLIGGTTYGVARKKGKFFEELFVSGMGEKSYSNIVAKQTTKIISLEEESTIKGLKITPVQTVCDGFFTSVLLKITSEGDIVLNENSRFSDDIIESTGIAGEGDEIAIGGGHVVRYEESEDALYYTLLAKGSDLESGKRAEFIIYVEDLIGLYINAKGKPVSTINKGKYEAKITFEVPEVSRLYLESDRLGEEGFIKVYSMGATVVTDLQGGNSKFITDILDYEEYNYVLLKDGKRVPIEMMGGSYDEETYEKGEAILTFEEPIEPSQVEEINLWNTCIKNKN